MTTRTSVDDRASMDSGTEERSLHLNQQSVELIGNPTSRAGDAWKGRGQWHIYRTRMSAPLLCSYALFSLMSPVHACWSMFVGARGFSTLMSKSPLVSLEAPFSWSVDTGSAASLAPHKHYPWQTSVIGSVASLQESACSTSEVFATVTGGASWHVIL